MDRFSKWIIILPSRTKFNIKTITTIILTFLNFATSTSPCLTSTFSQENDLIVGSNGTRVSESNRSLSTLSWSIAATLLFFFCLIHLIVMICFGLHWHVSADVVPIALLLSLIIGSWLALKEGLRDWQRVAQFLITLVIVSVSLFLASKFFDLSWDGLWYHQTAVYQMSHGWNPVYDPMHNFVPHLQDWLRYYAKGPWYIALALFEMTRNIEIAKAAPWIVLMATFFAVFAVSIDFGMRRRTAVLIAALVSLNPVVTCQLASYLVDGLMISFLACFVAAMFRWFRRPSLLILVIAMSSAILCINTKFTGLVYCCFFCAAGGLYIILKRRDLLWRYARIQFVSILLGTVVFGFNPYITNTVHRGNPFYPMLGTAAYPSLSERGQDPIERDETPHNMVGRNRFVRFAYAIFGRPGSQPFFQGENANLMWPFDIGWKDFHIFYFHEVRISGFGPLFSGALLISLILLGIVLVHGDMPREIIILFVGAIILSTLISNHTWWARYGPQLWWLPIVAVIVGFSTHDWRVARLAAFTLALILLINGILVAAAHFRWEMEATQTTYNQMVLLREIGEVDVDFQYFGEPFSERLRAAGVTFRAVRRLQCDKPMELMSVAPGYPGAVRICIHKR